ncbi:16S rRNA (guanine(527)-N(7))-methyltransferase RsmG [Spongiibacter taiwanensis]|uniref:16S rRNA (guanine(527)-N(7))-methyltransferase RsmG n=1 Tax=Spongiibacter taiwanensis TaxID=1748242 RepID=UPI0020354827|nr:16S rRNA (guanine(527)-N(7))-methyltransferase RsmG [Spongiibacter taiwanensis]USA41809.1 16S rRNA (guanine(527)-N(7))-methyltransferase RsmG [Spongiibacter taiwanensis]
MEELRPLLKQGSAELGLSLSTEQGTHLLEYLALLHKWNRAYNLTAIREPRQMLIKHLLDSLSIARYLEGGTFLDVGTGPGLPGIPLAILHPDKQFELLDSNGKKTRFLIESKARLGLKNVSVHCHRIEQFNSDHLFDGVISRAFSSLAEMAGACAPQLAPTGQLYAMKGLYPEEELSHLPKHFIVKRCISLSVPGLDEARHLLLIVPDRTDTQA